MGLLTHLFAATSAELATLPLREGARDWPGAVLAGGITDLHLAALEEVLCGGDPAILYEREPEWVREAGPDGPWVMQVPPPLAQALARLAPSDLPTVAARWAATDELAAPQVSPADLEPLLAELLTLAHAAEAQGRTVYLWVSL